MEGICDLLAVPIKHISDHSKEHSKDVEGPAAGDLESGRLREGAVLDLLSSELSNVDRDEWVELDLDVYAHAACVGSGKFVHLRLSPS